MHLDRQGAPRDDHVAPERVDGLRHHGFPYAQREQLVEHEAAVKPFVPPDPLHRVDVQCAVVRHEKSSFGGLFILYVRDV